MLSDAEALVGARGEEGELTRRIEHAKTQYAHICEAVEKVGPSMHVGLHIY